MANHFSKLREISVFTFEFSSFVHVLLFFFRKFEEIYPPELSEFVYVTDDTYTQKQILRMEHLVLKVLSFDVAIPTANLFLEKYLKDANADEKTKSLAMVNTCLYINLYSAVCCEVSILSYKCSYGFLFFYITGHVKLDSNDINKVRRPCY